MPTVREVMQTDVPTVAPHDRVETVLHALRDHERTGLPVVNEGGRCVGIVTEADLVIPDDERDLKMPPGGLRPPTVAQSAAHPPSLTSPPRSASTRSRSAGTAARLIAAKDHDQLPVVEHGRYLGVVTRLDVLEALSR